LDHPCVAPGTMSFLCPADNTDRRTGPTLENGTYALRCRVCGMRETTVVDEDVREGHIKATLFWGPNALEGVVDESVVTGYFVYFADSCSRKLGESVAYVPKLGTDQSSSSSCCQHDLYSATIVGEWPPGLEGNITLMVVPETDMGELSVGLSTEPLEDLVDKEVVVHGGRTNGAVACVGGVSPIAASAWLVAVALISFWR